MIWDRQFREVISGQRRGVLAAALRGTLSLAEKAYAAGIYVRNRHYDRRPSAVHHVSVPVISVGNLTTGGTGKTPLVAWIARWYHDRGIRVGLVSRGYGARAGEPNDEALELKLQLPDLPHLLNPNRVAAAQSAIHQHNCELLVLDDAFQHRRLHRDLDLVVIDALAPLGYGRLLPRGLLREPVSELRRANIVALSRADLLSDAERAALKSEILRRAPGAPWLEVAFRPRALVDFRGERTDVAALRGRRVAAFCGIGNPVGFRRTLEVCGAETVGWREYPDHFAYGAADIAALARQFESLDVDVVLCTMKDLVKVRVDRLMHHPLRAMAIDVELLAGRDELESLLHALLAHTAAR